MKYHLPVGRGPGPYRYDKVFTLCGRWLGEGHFLRDGASEYVRERYGCKSCLRSAGQKRQSHQGQEDHE